MKKIFLAVALVFCFVLPANAQVYVHAPGVNVGVGGLWRGGYGGYRYGGGYYGSPLYGYGAAVDPCLPALPAYSATYAAPVYSAPVYSTPFYGVPAYGVPFYGAGYGVPFYGAGHGHFRARGRW